MLGLKTLPLSKSAVTLVILVLQVLLAEEVDLGDVVGQDNTADEVLIALLQMQCGTWSMQHSSTMQQ